MTNDSTNPSPNDERPVESDAARTRRVASLLLRSILCDEPDYKLLPVLEPMPTVSRRGPYWTENDPVEK